MLHTPPIRVIHIEKHAPRPPKLIDASWNFVLIQKAIDSKSYRFSGVPTRWKAPETTNNNKPTWKFFWRWISVVNLTPVKRKSEQKNNDKNVDWSPTNNLDELEKKCEFSEIFRRRFLWTVCFATLPNVYCEISSGKTFTFYFGRYLCVTSCLVKISTFPSFVVIVYRVCYKCF